MSLRYAPGTLARRIELRIRFLEQAERIEARRRDNLTQINAKRIERRAAPLRVDLRNAEYRQQLLNAAVADSDDELRDLIEQQRRDGSHVWRPRHIVSLDAPYYRDHESGDKHTAMLGSVI